ncbi:hypothetical protein RBU61_13035 [Tissierella sp. MB52-C2]|uniref:hypothetical protein n=1 Tax=Tissierella sp. MB52-C2 TaxID=3070999 RepID=UPI00280BD70E|nr:hypothetical protein [Tissierella sp. MB52-C2]WMM23846.1 hypothetical protein RBU61_13035 [Tissierella sp. MB52-C2]
MFDDFMNADILTTFVGMTTAVTVVVQFTKSIVKNKFGDSAVRFYSFFIALILTIIFKRDSSGIEGIVLIIINTMMITMASIGSYHMLSDPMAKR